MIRKHLRKLADPLTADERSRMLGDYGEWRHDFHEILKRETYLDKIMSKQSLLHQDTIEAIRDTYREIASEVAFGVRTLMPNPQGCWKTKIDMTYKLNKIIKRLLEKANELESYEFLISRKVPSW